MALNTPKRIKLFNTFVQSPDSDHNVEWQDSFDDDASVNKSSSAVTNRSDTANSSNGICNGNGSLSPASSSCDSPEFSARNHSNTSSNISTNSHSTPQNLADARENRRGRPRSEALTTLMIEGSTSPSSIKCSYCNRVFPREKSLQAHLRTHTGERPYHCDYPGCTRAFTQSGQLKTHQRLHTGERPFMCSAPKCQMRFTHANRHCPEHPYDQLKRCDGYVIQAVTEQNDEVVKWLERYKMEKEDRTPTRKTPKRTKLCNSDENHAMRTSQSHERSNENYNIATGCDENKCPVTPNNTYKSRKGLMVELDMNAGLGASPITGTKMKPTPKVIRWHEPLSQEEDSADEFEMAAQSAFNPKKRWLREAWQNDLARPLEPITNGRYFSMENHKWYDKQTTTATTAPYHMLSPPKQPFSNSAQQRIQNDQNQMNPNQLRPTVLMVASKDRTMPLTNLTANAISMATTKNASQVQVQAQPQLPTSTNYVNHSIAAKSISFPNPVSSDCFDLQHKHNGIDTDGQLDRKPAIASSTPIAAATASNRNGSNSANSNSSCNDGSNRKWMGALALMELATDENHQVSSTMPRGKLEFTQNQL